MVHVWFQGYEKGYLKIMPKTLPGSLDTNLVILTVTVTLTLPYPYELFQEKIKIFFLKKLVDYIE